MTLLINDALLEQLADEFVALKLNRHGINLLQFINAPGMCRDLALLREQKARAKTGRVDVPMKHKRYPRSRTAADFRRRVQP